MSISWGYNARMVLAVIDDLMLQSRVWAAANASSA
jgi:hypothetical protein